MNASERPTEPGADLHARAREARLTPLWTFFNEWFTAEPTVDAIGHLWRYDALRALLIESARAISAEAAERRVLVLENPALAGHHLVTNALYAGLQLIMPGEIAPAHRHTPAALRFIVEGRGAYTAVSGERSYMEPGDFIVTPSWTWHEHGNEGNGPTVWMDVLDVPLVRFLGAGFSERYVSNEFPQRSPAGYSRYRYGMNMLPSGYRPESPASPLFSYPYAQAREVLGYLKNHHELDPHHAVRMEYIDPTTGGPAIPTLSTFLQLVPASHATTAWQSTASAVYAVVEGSGSVAIGTGDAELRFAYGPRDIWALPSWQPITIRAEEETIVFSASNEAVQRKLGIFRERRETGDAAQMA